MSNMKAKLLLKTRTALADNAFVEMVVWQVPVALAGSVHLFKYRLVLVVDGQCVLRYDNEAGKGDHKHVGVDEVFYRFTTPMKLVEDFQRDIQRWQDEYGNF